MVAIKVCVMDWINAIFELHAEMRLELLQPVILYSTEFTFQFISSYNFVVPRSSDMIWKAKVFWKWFWSWNMSFFSYLWSLTILSCQNSSGAVCLGQYTSDSNLDTNYVTWNHGLYDCNHIMIKIIFVQTIYQWFGLDMGTKMKIWIEAQIV